MLIRAAGAVLLSVASICAQSGAQRFALPEPMLTIEFESLAKLKKTFADTNIGAMFASQEFAALIDRGVALIGEEMGPGEADNWKFMEEVLGMLEGYSGRVRISGRFDGMVESDFGGYPRFAFTVCVDPDENIDFAAIADKIVTKVGEEENVDAVDTELGEVSVITSPMDDEMKAMLPSVLDDHLVMAIGYIDDYVAELGRSEGASTGDPADAISMRVKASLWRPFLPMLAEEAEFDVDPLIERIDAFESFALSIRPAGEFMKATTTIDFDGSRANFIDMLKVNARPADLMAMASRERPYASCLSINVEEILSFVETMADAAGEDLSMFEAQAEEMLGGISVRDDILAQFDGTIMSTTELDEEDMSVTYTMGLKDAAAFRKTLDRALESRGLDRNTKTEEYRGSDITSLNLGFFELCWAFTDKHLMLGFGTIPDVGIRKLLDGNHDRKEGAEPAKWPKAVSARLAHAPQKFDWISVNDADVDLDLANEGIMWELEDRGVPAGFAEILIDFVKLQKKFDLMTTVMTTTFGPGRLSAVGVW